MLVKFKLNKELDKKLIKEFLNVSEAGVDFGENIIRLHPKLKYIRKLPSKEKIRFISKYVDAFYQKNKNKINRKLGDIQTAWSKVEKIYFDGIKNIFGFKRKIKREFTAYFSIINACPRWISKKEFCLGFNYPIKGNLQIICHEVTHFFFYDYLSKNFPKSLTYHQKWTFSEIFNVILLNKKPFSGLYAPIKEYGYPSHRKYIRNYRALYQKSRNLHEFFRKGIRLTKQLGKGDIFR